MTGDRGSDRIYGRDGNDTIFGHSITVLPTDDNAVDYLYGEAGDDTSYGGGGDDVVDGGTGMTCFAAVRATT